MCVRITYSPRPFFWDSTTAIAETLGMVVFGEAEAEAELWFGLHPGSPSVILVQSRTNGAKDFAEWISGDVWMALGRCITGGRPPLLLTFIAVVALVLLHAHSPSVQTEESLSRESTAVPSGVGRRNYKEELPEPERSYALSPQFDVLCGFRSLCETLELITKILERDASCKDPQPRPLEDLYVSHSAADGLHTIFERRLSNSACVGALIVLVNQIGEAPRFDILRSLAIEYPGELEIYTSLLFNRIEIAESEALCLPAGKIHKYLTGFGIERMAASDNALYRQTSPKRINLSEALTILDFCSVSVPSLALTTRGARVNAFTADDEDLLFVRGDGDDLPADFAIDGQAMLISTAAEETVTDHAWITVRAHGESIHLTSDVGGLRFIGTNWVFILTASPGARNSSAPTTATS